MPKAKYVLMPKLLTPEIDPGAIIELEIFLTGGGAVEKNKLFLNYPSVIINKENAGEIISSISTAIEKDTNRILQPVSGNKYLQTTPCGPIGTTVNLTEGYFLAIPHDQPTPSELNRIMAENKWDDHAPLLVKLNTNKKAPSGNYDIGLALSYVSDGDVEISKEVVKVHITSWADRHQRASIIMGIIGVVAAVLALYGLVK